MRFRKYTFLREKTRLRAEGYDLNRLLDICVKENISVRRVITIDETAIEMTVKSDDFIRLKKAVRNRYRFCVLKKSGISYITSYIWKRKISVAGALIFVLIIIYQSMFIAEIEVSGYSSVSEESIRNTLKEAGFYEGVKKPEDTSDIKLAVYNMSDDITFISITYEGRKAFVDIAEAKYISPSEKGKGTPCSIVSDYSCYIDEIRVKKGHRVKEQGDYVKKGETLISGIVPNESTAYGTDAEKIKEYYVCAQGDVWGIIPYEYVFYEEYKKEELKETGRKVPYINICFGDMNFTTDEIGYIFEKSIKKEKIKKEYAAVPLTVTAGIISEIRGEKKKRTEKEIRNSAESKLREEIKKNLPEDAQIINKSLKFYREKNIINVYAQLEVKHKIGKEEEIRISDPEPEQ